MRALANIFPEIDRPQQFDGGRAGCTGEIELVALEERGARRAALRIVAGPLFEFHDEIVAAIAVEVGRGGIARLGSFRRLQRNREIRERQSTGREGKRILRQGGLLDAIDHGADGVGRLSREVRSVVDEERGAGERLAVQAPRPGRGAAETGAEAAASRSSARRRGRPSRTGRAPTAVAATTEAVGGRVRLAIDVDRATLLRNTARMVSRLRCG